MKRIFICVNAKLNNSTTPTKFEREFKRANGIRVRYLETVGYGDTDATLLEVHPNDMENMLALVDGTNILNWNEIDRKALPRRVINKYHL